jgi:hypothetical protein
MNQTFQLTLDVPDGWEATGEYREPTALENYLTREGRVGTGIGPAGISCFILRRAWVPPTWMPIDNWLYNNSEQWRVTNRAPRVPTPESGGWGRSVTGAITVEARVLAALYGQTFTPPPAHCNRQVYQL